MIESNNSKKADDLENEAMSIFRSLKAGDEKSAEKASKLLIDATNLRMKDFDISIQNAKVKS